MSAINFPATVRLEVCNWRQTIRSPLEPSKGDVPFKSPPRETWDVVARFQDPNVIELSNGLHAGELEVSLWVIDAGLNADWVEKYKLQNTSGALIFHDDATNSFIGGTLVLDESSFQSSIAAVKTGHCSSSLCLTLNGLQSVESDHANHTWDIEKRLTITHVEMAFKYE